MATFKINKVFKNGKVSKMHDLVEAATEAEAREIYTSKHGKKYQVFGLEIAEVLPSAATEKIAAINYTGTQDEIEALQNEIDADVHEHCSSALEHV